MGVPSDTFNSGTEERSNAVVSSLFRGLGAKKRLQHFPVFQLFVLYKHRKFLVKYSCGKKSVIYMKEEKHCS